MDWISIVGTLAALCTTLSFVPQLVKMRRQGGRDLSWAMLTAKMAGLALWFGYGLLIRATPVLVANAATMALVGTGIVMKSLGERRQARTAAPGRGPRRLRIAIDMDEVIVDALGEHLRRYNARFGTSLTASDVRGRPLDAAVPPDRRAAAVAMLDESFFEGLEPIDGALDAIRRLQQTHEIFIATAAMEVPVSFAAKYRWLRAHMPFIPTSHIVFCGDKTIVDADVLIDDSPRHFARFKGRGLLFSAPHNVHETRYERVHGWQEVLDRLAPDDGADEEQRAA